MKDIEHGTDTGRMGAIDPADWSDPPAALARERDLEQLENRDGAMGGIGMSSGDDGLTGDTSLSWCPHCLDWEDVGIGEDCPCCGTETVERPYDERPYDEGEE